MRLRGSPQRPVRWEDRVMARPREGVKVVFVEAPAELVERLRALAKRNRRSMNGEALVAIERHVEAEGAPRVDLLAAPPEGKAAAKPRPGGSGGKGKGKARKGG
jgi:hypothetical protein